MDLKKHFLSILESLYDAVIVIDQDSTIVYINQAYTRQFGVPPQKLIGRKLRDIEPNARILDVLRDGKPRINDYSYVRSLGQHVYANMTPLIEEGQVIGVVTIMKDISEIKTLQKQLENYRKQLSRLEEQLYQKDGFTLLESQVPSMQRAVSLARRVAPTDATVLLTGEPVWEKNCLPKRFTKPANAGTSPLYRSTWHRYPILCLKARCSVTRKAPLPDRARGAKEA